MGPFAAHRRAVGQRYASRATAAAPIVATRRSVRPGWSRLPRAARPRFSGGGRTRTLVPAAWRSRVRRASRSAVRREFMEETGFIVQVQSFLDVFSDGWMCQLGVARRTACASCIASRRPVAPKGRGLLKAPTRPFGRDAVRLLASGDALPTPASAWTVH